MNDYLLGGKNMPDKKRKVGRPRKYDTRAERQKAYYERKKKKMESLEKKVEILQKQTPFSLDSLEEILEDYEFNKSSELPWEKFTPSEIGLMGTKNLEFIVNKYKEELQEFSSFENTLENIIMGILSKNFLESRENPSREKITGVQKRIEENISTFINKVQKQTLLYLLEAELTNRERLEGKEKKLDLFEAKIEELEKEAKKKKIEIQNKAK